MVDEVLLFSGGIDSTLTLAWAVDRGHDVHLLEFDHPTRPKSERAAAKRIARRFSIQGHTGVNLPFIMQSPASPVGYLAARNLVFHAVAQSLAESIGAPRVLAGHHASDAATFPDARPAYLAEIARLAARGRPRHQPIRIRFPLARMTDAQLARLARRLDAPLDEAWSCWKDQPKACGRCEKCRRKAAILRLTNG